LAQLSCVLSGGSLYQDVNNHLVNHSISLIDDGTVFDVTSSHHQMMDPFSLNEEDYDLLAVSTEAESTYYTKCYTQPGIQVKGIPAEPEIVYFKKTKALAIQCHPEWMVYDEDYEFLDYLNDIIWDLFFV